MLPYPSHRHSVTGNDRIMIALSSFQNKIFKGGCKKGVLMQYKCMEKEISELSMEGFYFPHLPCISRIFRPECSFGREEAMNPCIQALDIFPRRPGAQGRQNEFCRFVKKYDNIKNTDTIPCSMSPHSRTTRAGLTQVFPAV